MSYVFTNREGLTLIALRTESAPSSPSDFRLIALLSFLSKVLEKIPDD